ncbi:MAG: glutathione peroxidase [Bdellovibrionales bacterium]|nr:glutathione peroxidase [Bdellovibrionales bacterium]
MNIYDFSVKDASGVEVALREFEGKVLLVVNTASACGFTPQYEGLQEMYSRFRESGFEILAFPCNQFGGQEPGTDQEIQSFCSLNYGVTFRVFSKIDVNGERAHPLFQFLKSEAPGVLGTEAIKWNFTKFLVSRSGKVKKRFAPQDKPSGIAVEVEKELNSSE